MFTHRTCVARIDERLFCPTNASPLFAPGSMAYAASYDDQPYAPVGLANDANHDSDDEDHETGGVRIAPSHNIDDDMIVEAAQAEHSLADSRTRPNTGSVLPNTPSMSGNPHPRPESRQVREEEDGRRMRFALGADGLGDGPYVETSVASHRRMDMTVEALDVGALTRAASLSSSASTAQHPSRRPSRDVLSLQGATRMSFIPSASDIESARQLIERRNMYDIPMDDDSLAVDDPLRNYDVADFIENWRLHALRDRRLPTFEPGKRPSIRQWQAPEKVTRDEVTSRSLDMQGIPWPLLGPSRKHAESARTMLHPTGPGTASTQLRKRMNEYPAVGDDERHYQFRAFVSKHRAKSNHYQLRNVLAASSRNDIFYSTGSKVMRASLACPTLSETIMDLPRPCQRAGGFRITCLSASPRSSISPYETDTVLFAGGFNGEYAMRNLNGNSNSHTEGEVTSCYNGLVTHIHNYADRRSGLLRAAFCSNDRKLRLMDVRSLRFDDTFSYDYSINCSATSTDGRLRALVGDSCETLITDAEQGNTLLTLREHSDHGFACAWSHDGRNVATGAQDGKVVVWDTRNWSAPVSTLFSSMSCARSLNFSDTGALVVAENDDVVKVYDGGSFASFQEIRFFGSIAGVALMDGGAEMAVANADSTVGGLMSFVRSPEGMSDTYGAMGPDSFRRRGWKKKKAMQEADLTSGVIV